MGRREDLKSGTYAIVMTIRKVLSHIKLQSGFTFGSVWFLFVQGFSRDSRTLGSPQSRVVGPDLVYRSEIVETVSHRRKEQWGLDSTGISEKHWEYLPELSIQGTGAFTGPLTWDSPTGSWSRLTTWATWTPQPSGESEWHRCAWGGMMPFSTAVAGIRHEPKECDMGHQVSAQGWQSPKVTSAPRKGSSLILS